MTKKGTPARRKIEATPRKVVPLATVAPTPCDCGRQANFDRCARVECAKNHGQLTVGEVRGSHHGSGPRLAEEYPWD